MRRLHALSFAVLLAAAGSSPAQAPTSVSRVFVGTCTFPNFPGTGGIYVAPASQPAALLPLAGLPAELAGACCGSAGTNCVTHVPGTNLLAAGNAVLNGGAARAFVLDVQGTTATTVASLACGVLPFDGGVNAVAPVSTSDILLGLGPMTSGPGASAPILRWNWVTGTASPMPLPAPYPTGNMCNALVVTRDRTTAIAGLRWNNVGGALMRWDLATIDLATNAFSLIATLLTGEFPTQMAWDCNGDLLVSTAQFPLTLGAGRMLTVRRIAGAWILVNSTVIPGQPNLNGIASDPAGCTTFVNGNDLVGPAYRSEVLTWNGAAATTWSSGPVGGWGLVMGIATQPNPEVLEVSSGASAASTWDYTPFPGGAPTAGSTLGMRLRSPGAGIAVSFLDLARGNVYSPALGLQMYVTPAAVPLNALALPDPQWTWTLPAQPVFLGTTVYAQAAVLDLGGLGASDLLQFTIR